MPARPISEIDLERKANSFQWGKQMEQLLNDCLIEKMKIKYCQNDWERNMSTEMLLIALSIIQDHLINIARSGCAGLVSRSVNISDFFTIEIDDNGNSLDLSDERNVQVLSIIKRRAALLQGTYSIFSTSGRKTLLQIEWPISHFPKVQHWNV